MKKILRFQRVPKWTIDLILIGFFGALLFFCRWDSIIYPLPLNPDEVQLAANTLRISTHGFNWNSMDGTTSGPLNSIALLWPKLIGLEVTIGTARLTALFALILVCAYVYFTLRLSFDRLVAVLFLMPLVLFYSLTESPDFLHYSSEIVPLLLLVVANFFIIKISLYRGTPRANDFLLVGVLVGAVPFAKLQATPIAFVMGLYALYLSIKLRKTERIRRLSALAFGALSLSAFILLPLYFSGELKDFWLSYIIWSGTYIGDSTSIRGIYSMVSSDATLKHVSYFLVFIWVLIQAGSAFSFSMREIKARAASPNLAYLFVLVLISFWAIAKPGKQFPHYLMFFPPFVVIYFCYSSFLFYPKKPTRLIFLIIYFFLSLFFIFSHWYDKNKGELNFQTSKYKTILKQSLLTKNQDLYSWIPTANQHLLVWGWMPQWYLLANKSPATRESHTYAQIVNTKLTDYFRSRFLIDFEKSVPAVVIDAVIGNSFGFNDSSKFSPDIFPEFSKILSEQYTNVAPMIVSSACPKIYVKNELIETLRNRLVIPRKIDATATYGGVDSIYSKNNLFDNSLTEDACVDYWLLPDNEVGTLSMLLSASEKISALMILNTRNGNHVDRSSNKVKIVFRLKNKVLKSDEIYLRPYPYWTNLEFAELLEVDKIDIEVLSFNGLGGGLNEIKILRKN